jgi:hypothetical protein
MNFAVSCWGFRLDAQLHKRETCKLPVRLAYLPSNGRFLVGLPS